MPVKGRFAPSPTGRMHAGNIYASLMAWLVAKVQGGSMVLRIEDLDRDRSKQHFADQIMRDYEMLELFWDEGPVFQHDREEAYRQAFGTLCDKGLVYPCFCSRADLHAASAPHRGEKLVYAGTCRNLTEEQVLRKIEEGRSGAYRLRVPDETIILEDGVQGPYSQQLERDCGDFLIKRSDGAFAYQLAVVVDDAACGVTSVVRGVDLLCSTPQQIYLQELLGYARPDYAHVPLLVAQQGRRLSKRDKDASLDELLARYKTPRAVLGHIAYVVGLQPADEPASPEQLLSGFSLDSLPAMFPDKVQLLFR